MTFTLKPDDNGIVVVLTNVDENDINKLETANKKGFDPTEEPFNKYYDYDRNIGFYVNKDHFDHAQHKGKRLSFGDYVAIVSEGEVMPVDSAIDAVDCLHVIKDSKFAADFIIDRIMQYKVPTDVQTANNALSLLNFALFNLAKSIDDVDESKKEKLHKAMSHAFDIYAKAEEILAKSELQQLIDLEHQTERARGLTADVQGKLLDKFHENF